MVAYGLDAELAAKAEAKYDHELEKQVVEWMQAVTGEQKEGLTFSEWLNDGQVLCKVVNAIQPGTIKRINTMKAPFKKMENITAFTNAARALGVSESAMFATPDLFEDKNLGSVVNCIYTFAGVVQTVLPEYAGPKLGNPVQASKDAPREKKMATQSGGLAGTMDKAAASTAVRDIASAAGGNKASAARPQSATTASMGGGFASGAYESEAVSLDADAQGLDADLKKKMAEKYNPEEDRQVCEWIEAVTGTAKGEQSTADYLKSGEVLCDLANKIKPGSVTGVAKSTMPFKQMENLKKFLDAARAMGMSESSLFSTPDLYEEKNMSIVVTALFAFGGVVQAKVPEFKGPHLGVAIKVDVGDVSRGIGLVTDQTEAMQRTMEKGETRLDTIIRD